MRPVSIESTLWLFFLYRTSLINAIMNFFLNQKFKNRTKESCSNYIFFEKCLYQIYKEKVFFFSCSRNWNWESNLTCEPKMAQRITWLHKKIFRNLSSTLYFEKTKKNKASIWRKPEFELPKHFTAETKNDILFWFWYIYT